MPRCSIKYNRKMLPNRNSSRLNKGFTITELLVVMGILAFLMALILPAVMNARAAARTLQCKDNLKNIGLGLTQFETSNGSFPGAYAGYIGKKPTAKYYSFSPSSMIAGFIDSQSLANTVQFEQPANEIDPNWLKSSLPSPAILRCPDDPLSNGSSSNYRFCRGLLPLWPQDPGGVFVRNDQGFSAAAITDGLSMTAFASERLIYSGTPSDRASRFVTVFGDDGFEVAGSCLSANESGSIDSYPNSVQSIGTSWMSGRWLHASYYHLFPPNSSLVDCVSDTGLNLAVITARSHHSGGVNVLFGDGSVRFITNQINLQIWRAMATRAGGDSPQ
jgi:prepilin-type N-terminal cleavage/methylation domain-containing protein/prepilin-type processing-associated H-X9-DG protein